MDSEYDEFVLALNKSGKRDQVILILKDCGSLPEHFAEQPCMQKTK